MAKLDAKAAARLVGIPPAALVLAAARLTQTEIPTGPKLAMLFVGFCFVAGLAIVVTVEAIDWLRRAFRINSIALVVLAAVLPPFIVFALAMLTTGAGLFFGVHSDLPPAVLLVLAGVALAPGAAAGYTYTDGILSGTPRPSPLPQLQRALRVLISPNECAENREISDARMVLTAFHISLLVIVLFMTTAAPMTVAIATLVAGTSTAVWMSGCLTLNGLRAADRHPRGRRPPVFIGALILLTPPACAMGAFAAAREMYLPIFASAIIAAAAFYVGNLIAIRVLSELGREPT